MSSGYWFVSAIAAVFVAGMMLGLGFSEPDTRVVDNTTVINVSRPVQVQHETRTRYINVTKHPDVTVKRRIRDVPTAVTVDECRDEHERENIGSITGVSMHPSISTGTDIVAVEYTDQDLERGMRIRYMRNNSAVIHTVYGVYPDYVLTKGDSNRYYDDNLNRSAITHVVCGELYPNN